MFHELSKIKFSEQHISPEVERQIPALFKGYKEALFDSAVSASKRGSHWDKNRPVPMHVGCAMLILENGQDLSEPKIITGANKKESPDILAYPDRQCAEMAAKNNALTTRGQFTEEDQQLERKGEEIHEGNLKNEGLIAVIVTASPSHNTGESDTKSHDLVHPCKQCQENYKLLLKEKRVSPQTIVCSLRIDNGKLISQQMPLGELLKKLEDENKNKVEKSIAELQNLFNQQTQLFLTKMSPYDEELRQRRLDGLKIFEKSEEIGDYAKFLRDLDRERKEQAFSLLDEIKFRPTMLNAIKSVTEEGVPKIEALSAILPPERVGKVNWERDRSDLSSIELNDILDILCNRLLFLSRNPEIAN